MHLKYKKALLYSLLIINALLIIGFWWMGSGSFFSTGTAGTLIALGRIAGLLGAFSMLLQLLLIGRVAWLERIFGLDKLSRAHRTNGIVAFFLIITHPILLIFGYGISGKSTFIGQFISFTNFPGVLLAVIAFALLIALIVLTWVIIRRRLKYEAWYATHVFMYAVIVLAFFHQIWNGGDLLSNKYFMWYWYVLYIFVFGNLIIFRFVMPIHKSSRHQFRIMKVERETKDAYSVYITGKDMKDFRILPGQFMILRFWQRGFKLQEHPFSVSGYDFNGKRYFRITIKAIGDYTGTIKNLRKGTRVIIDGPHGVFTAKNAARDKFLLIAGGVGITPLRSIAQEQLISGKDVILLYGNRTQEDIIFRKEFDDLKKRYPQKFHLHHVLSDDKRFKGEKGFVNKDRIARLAPDYKRREIYICGPVIMMKTLISGLKEMGMDMQYVHYERFAL